MLVPIVCCTDGYPIGDVACLFQLMRARRIAEVLGARGTVAAHAASDAGLQIDCSDILDRLGVKHDCCRKTLATAMLFDQYFR